MKKTTHTHTKQEHTSGGSSYRFVSSRLRLIMFTFACIRHGLVVTQRSHSLTTQLHYFRCVDAAPAPEYWNKGAMGSFLGGTWRAHGARAYNGGLGQSPWSGGQGGEAPLKLKAFLALGRATDRANLYPLQYFQQSIK